MIFLIHLSCAWIITIILKEATNISATQNIKMKLIIFMVLVKAYP